MSNLPANLESVVFDVLAGYALERVFPGLPLPGDEDDRLTVQDLGEALQVLPPLDRAEAVKIIFGDPSVTLFPGVVDAVATIRAEQSGATQ